MSEKNSLADLEEKLNLLQKNFLFELRKIEEQRLKILEAAVSPVKVDLPTENKCEKKIAQKTFTVRLESSLGEKLAKTRETSDGLEDKLQETRVVFEDKLKTIDLMKDELNRRENVLINSIRQIEAYLRAVFYLKQDADKLRDPIIIEGNKQRKILRKLMGEIAALNDKKECLLKAIRALQPLKLHLEKMTADLTEYSNVHDLVEYYLVLELLQEDLLADESQCPEEKRVIHGEQLISGLEKYAPTTLLSKETEFLHLSSELKNLKVQILQLEEQIDTATINKVKDAAAGYDMQKWIKKLYSATTEHCPPEKTASSILDMLSWIRDFVADHLEIAERLKTENTA